ncbi:vWA domain-containing protein [Halovivax gelatinilyticus]|uniref:vWA domain-containing protein n=1 Tax=Halovivax gelatinilyticus TaxID=2961597 RepID=UPI0020CA675C|nr:VWA domain-containing protein [Halovivax gelatinilyticus]
MPVVANTPSGTVDDQVDGVQTGPPGDGAGPPGHDRGSNATDIAVADLGSNGSLETVLEATDQLGEVDFDDDTGSIGSEIVSSVNSSVEFYRHVDHIDDREAYEHLGAAQAGLADLVDEVSGYDAETVDNSSERLYAATNRSARLAVVDAALAIERYDDEFRNPGQRQSAESALGNAVDALERADETLSEDPEIVDRERATGHLETAWKHADRAIDVVEDTVDPSLDASVGVAFEHDGTVLVPVEAVLSDVRPYDYDEVDVAVEAGDVDPDPIHLLSPESSGTVATGTTMVDVGSDLENATLTLTASASDDRSVEETVEIEIDEDDVVWTPPDPDEYHEIEVEDEDSGVTVAAGGDGLDERHLSVDDETPSTDDPYRAGPMVRIENRTDVDEATVSIPIDEGAVDRDGNLSVVTWDPHNGEPWQAVETDVDEEAGVATAEVDSFSFFSAFWIDDWEDHTSDTVVLDDGDDNATDPGGDFEKIDLVFVIDESGSMSGDRIENARKGAQRFVGALVDDEQGALAGFDSSARLHHSLTTDHDALNTSIEGISAGGLTNTAAGLNEGLDELERNGWENRTPVIILLADGHTNRGGDPVDVAETAAERGVEISTIGLGDGIDEDELREIAAATGGDFYHVVDAEDLPDTFDRVADNQTGVDLLDTNGDGIPDRVAEMNLSMPTGEPGVVGEPLDIHPTRLDTSSDGILDNETVEIDYRIFEEDNQTKLYASVTYAEHHPARTDTTGDGLSDVDQISGWDIDVIDDHDDAQTTLEIVADPDDDRDPAAFLETREVASNPLVSDTSGNGLADKTERTIGTDPQRVDTTGDGIADDVALDEDYEDPTVFTTTPPTPTLLEYDQWSEVSMPEAGWDPGLNAPEVDTGLDWNFRYTYRIVDPAGVGSYELSREGDVIASGSPAGSTYVNTVTYESFWEGTFTALRGSQSDLFVEDIHGNARQDLLYSQSSFYGEQIHKLPGLGAEHAGMLSGFTHSGAELPELVYSIVTGPGETAEAIESFLEEADAELLVEVVRAIPDHVQQQQRLDNPFTDGGDGCEWESKADDIADGITMPGTLPDHYSDCEKYAIGYYSGYVTHFLASLLYAGTITQAASDSVTVANRLSRASDRVGDLAHVGAASQKTNRVTDQFLRANGGAGGTVADRLIREQGSFGSGQALLAHTQRIGHTKLAQLPGDELRTFLLRHGDGGADLVRHLDVDDAAQVLSQDPAAVSRVLSSADDVSRQANVLTTMNHISRANQVNHADLALRHGDDFIEYANRFGDDAVEVLYRVADPADQRLLLDDSLARTGIVDLYNAQPVAAERVFELYNTRATTAAVRLGDDASIQPLIRVAQQGNIEQLQLVVTRGDRYLWVETPRFDGTVMEALPGFDRATAKELVFDTVVAGSAVELDDGAQYAVAPEEIGFDLDAEEIVIQVDDDGELTSFELE